MRWVNLGLLLLLAAGHAEIVVTVLNRVHGYRLQCRTLSRLRHLHDVLLVGVAASIVVFVGLTGPRLLAGGRWADVPGGWLAYFVVCAGGVAGLAWSSARWLLRRPPVCQTGNHSTVVDVAARLGRRPVARGPLWLLTRLPGNEIFRVEVAEKTFALPGLPRECDGLSILHLSDLHFIGTLERAFFEEVAELAAGLRADMAVFTGDLLDRQDLTAWFQATLGRIEAPLGRYFILGNHDWFLDPEATRRELAAIGWEDVAGRVAVIERGGCRVEVGGTELPWMGGWPEFASGARAEAGDRSGVRIEDGGSRMAADASRIDAGGRTADQGSDATTHDSPLTTPCLRILLSHTPDHIGWARRAGVDVMLSGHNHGGQVVLPVVGPVYSPSRYGVRYAGGSYWEPPTLLHVSRGVSGRHPLRWRCRPEVVKVVLRCGGVSG